MKVNKEMMEEELVKSCKHIYRGGERDSSLVSHKNHAFPFWVCFAFYFHPH